MRTRRILAGALALAACSGAPVVRPPGASSGPAPGPAGDRGQPPSLSLARRPPDLVDPCPDGGCRALVFFRPKGCGRPVRAGGRRIVQSCEAEERMEVLVRRDGTIASRPLDPGPPRPPYPVELYRQWRHCGPGLDDPRAFDPSRFARYEDPEVGPCLVLRDLDPAAVAAIRKPARLSLLAGLHPWVADATTRLVLAAAAEGIQVKVISGVRPHTTKVVTSFRTVKKAGKSRKVKVRKTVNRKGLHAWGLAVDLNLAHRNDLASATAAYVNGSVERAAWERVGDLAEAYGLYWLGRSDPNEIFHFEWHPTWPGRPKGKLRQTIDRVQATDGNPGVWRLLGRDPARRTFEHLSDS